VQGFPITRSVTLRCLSNSSLANFLVSARVLGSRIRLVARIIVLYRESARDRWRNCTYGLINNQNLKRRPDWQAYFRDEQELT
jgi:hypothetical protein